MIVGTRINSVKFRNIEVRSELTKAPTVRNIVVGIVRMAIRFVVMLITNPYAVSPLNKPE